MAELPGLDPRSDRLLARARRFLELCAPLVPFGRRDDWLREWEAEIWHHLTPRGNGAPPSGIELIGRLAGAIPHACWLRRGQWRLDMLLQDLRYAWRSTRKSPGLALLIAGTLALGIGANTAMFTVVNSILIQPLPYDEPHRLVFGYGSFAKSDRAAISPPDYLDYRGRNRSFASFAARSIGDEAVLSGSGEPERVQAASISANFFETLRVPPLHGRTFLPEEEEGPGHAVAILAHRLWERRFGSDPSIVGRTVIVNGIATEIVGVMPRIVDRTHQTELWRPIGFNGPETSVRRFHSLRAIGRLKDGVSLEAAQADINTIAAQLAATYPENETWTLRLIPYRDEVVGDIGRALIMLLGAVGLVLLVACGNVANLLLARATARRGEIMIRTALGASRVRLVRQLLTESLFLAVAGGLAGMVVAVGLVDLLRVLAGGILPRLSEIRIDSTVLLFTVALSLGTGLLFGLAPALHTAGRELTAALVSMGRGSTGRGIRARDVLVAGQVALSVVLLVGAGLMLRSLRELNRVDPGFDGPGVLTGNVSLAGPRYQRREAAERFWREAVDRLRAIPGVTAASAGTTVPLTGWNDTNYWIEGQPPASEAERRNAAIVTVADDYFPTLGIALTAGRDFGPSERSGGPPALVVNQSLAAKLFPGQSPLGRRIVVDFGRHFAAEIVGVVEDVKILDLSTPAPDMMYLSAFQGGGFGIRFLNLALRTEGDPTLLSRPLREAVAGIDRDLAVADLRTMENRVSMATSRERFITRLIGAFAVGALVLAVVGLYGILGYSVSQRSTEIGIRLALGAARQEVFRMVVRQGMVIVFAGIALGLVAAVGLTRLLASLLFQVGSTDPLVYGAVAALLATAGLAACAIPARRATLVDPVTALRAES